MDANKAKEIINAMIGQSSDADQIARLELCREYLFNADFRESLEVMLFEQFRANA